MPKIGDVVLTKAECRMMNRACWNWVRLVLRHKDGETLLLNLLFDYRKRPETYSAIAGFISYIASFSVYARRSTTGLVSASASAMGQVNNYCATSAATPPVTAQAPTISRQSLEHLDGNRRVARVMSTEKARRDYEVRSTIGQPVKSRAFLGGEVIWEQNQDRWNTASATARRTLEAIADRLPSPWVNFHTVRRLFPKKGSRSPHSTAKWACIKVGLIKKSGEDLSLISFDLDEGVEMWRPTTFSAAGYRAFCACDAADDFGRTMPLKRARIGVTELVLRDGEFRISNLATEDLGTLDDDTDILVNEDRIAAYLKGRIYS